MDALKKCLTKALIYDMHAGFFLGSKLLLSHSYGLPNTKWNNQKFILYVWESKSILYLQDIILVIVEKNTITLGQRHLC